MAFSLTEAFDDLPTIEVVDIGASWIDGPPPYQRLIDAGKAHLIGFEPAEEQFRALQQRAKPHETYLQFALGDGNDAMLNICGWPGWTSLLEPDLELIGHFHGFGDECRVVRREALRTRRLDDVDEVDSIDYLKLDVQGSELAVLQGGARKLSQALIVHVEVLFIPFYKGQPLFADIDQELLRAGFYLHRFNPMTSRLFKPLLANNSVYSGLSQVLWTDVVYVRRFTEFAQLSPESLLKIAFMLHDIYGSFDLAALALAHVDRKRGTQLQAAYLRRVTGQA